MLGKDDEMDLEISLGIVNCEAYTYAPSCHFFGHPLPFSRRELAFYLVAQ
jgi:hypothetical protein